MTLTPTQKQALSGVLVGVLVTALTAVEQVLTHPPFTLQALLVAAVAGTVGGLVHYLPALGTAEKVDAIANAKAADKLSAILDREAS